MQTRKRWLSIILVLATFISVLFCTGMNVCAESVTDGITVSVSSDKAEYDSDDEVKLEIIVKNTNDFEVSNLRIENILPDGIKIVSGKAVEENVTLKADGEKTVKLSVAKANVNSGTTPSTSSTPKTGESGIITILLAVLLIAGVIIVFALKGKKGFKFFSVVLCLCLIGQIAPETLVNAQNSTSEDSLSSLTAECAYKIDCVEYLHKVVVSYDNPLITSDGICTDEVYNTIDEAMNTVLFADDYDLLSIDEKKERMMNELEKLADRGLILKGSISCEEYSISFLYPDGYGGSVSFERFSGKFSGNADVNKHIIDRTNNGKPTRTVDATINFADVSYPFKENDIKQLGLKAKYMFGLCDSTDTTNDYYEYLEDYRRNKSIWDKQYLQTEIDEYCSVDDFKNGLYGYDVIFIETHGEMRKKQPVICTLEQVNNDMYLNDRNHLFIDKNDKDGKYYWLIKASFFEKYYGLNRLDNSIIWLGCCHGYQNDYLVEAFESCGADAVIGYNETVLTRYDDYLHGSFVYSLMHGDTVSNALEFSKDIWKDNDKSWWYELNSKKLGDDLEVDFKRKAEAKINFNGLNARLINLAESKNDEDRTIQLAILVMDSEDISPLQNKDVEITVSNSDLKCSATKQKTNVEGIVAFEFTTNVAELIAQTDITLRIDGYRDYTISDYEINTQGNIINEADAFMEKEESQQLPAIDLIDKTIPEIIDIMGGEYQVIKTENDGYIYIQNQTVLPGMEFYVAVSDEYTAGVQNGEELKNDSLRTLLESSEYTIDVIQVNGVGQVDSDITADMDYLACTQYLGVFECTSGTEAHLSGNPNTAEYTYTKNGANIRLCFYLDSDMVSKLLENISISEYGCPFTVEQMKECNPKLLNVVISKNGSTENSGAETAYYKFIGTELVPEYGLSSLDNIELDYTSPLDYNNWYGVISGEICEIDGSNYLLTAVLKEVDETPHLILDLYGYDGNVYHIQTYEEELNDYTTGFNVGWNNGYLVVSDYYHFNYVSSSYGSSDTILSLDSSGFDREFSVLYSHSQMGVATIRNPITEKVYFETLDGSSEGLSDSINLIKADLSSLGISHYDVGGEDASSFWFNFNLTDKICDFSIYEEECILEDFTNLREHI